MDRQASTHGSARQADQPAQSSARERDPHCPARTQPGGAAPKPYRIGHHATALDANGRCVHDYEDVHVYADFPHAVDDGGRWVTPELPESASLEQARAWARDLFQRDPRVAAVCIRRSLQQHPAVRWTAGGHVETLRRPARTVTCLPAPRVDLAAHFAAEQIECLVRTAAQATDPDFDPDELSRRQRDLAALARRLMTAEDEQPGPDARVSVAELRAYLAALPPDHAVYIAAPSSPEGYRPLCGGAGIGVDPDPAPGEPERFVVLGALKPAPAGTPRAARTLKHHPAG